MKRPRSAKALVHAELETIIDNPGLWLDTPNALFGGRMPRALIGTDDEHLIWEWIGAVKHGLVA